MKGQAGKRWNYPANPEAGWQAANLQFLHPRKHPSGHILELTNTQIQQPRIWLQPLVGGAECASA